MKILIVGLGNQGSKRIKFLKKYNYFASYDPYNPQAHFNSLKSIPLEKFDSVFLCVPDLEKYELIKFFLRNKKNVFVEKPLYVNRRYLKFLYSLAKINRSILYTAYNHRFEPNIINIKNDLKLLKDKIYNLRLYYGNGTAIDVKKSKWRDMGLGVISDLVPHLLDILIFTLGFKKISNIRLIKISYFENKSPDHAVLSFYYGKIFVEFEVSLCSWKNSFKYDLYSKSQSFHINSLNKWGNSQYTRFKRSYPSGIPKKFDISKTKTNDPTWLSEHNYLKYITNKKNLNLNISSYQRDFVIVNFLNSVSKLFR